MKKLIEFFKWDWEGEYQQYFFVTDNEEQFIQETLKYLNTVSINKEFFWSDCLVDYALDAQVEGYFLPHAFNHLREYYYIQDDDGKFSLTKHTNQVKLEDIRWNQ